VETEEKYAQFFAIFIISK